MSFVSTEGRKKFSPLKSRGKGIFGAAWLVDSAERCFPPPLESRFVEYRQNPRLYIPGRNRLGSPLLLAGFQMVTLSAKYLNSPRHRSALEVELVQEEEGEE